MSPYYETAAHTLLFLCRAGLTIRAGVDCRAVVWRLAFMIDLRNAKYADLSHAAAASWILDDLVRLQYASVDAKKLSKLLAILGTSIGNAEGHVLNRSKAETRGFTPRTPWDTSARARP